MEDEETPAEIWSTHETAETGDGGRGIVTGSGSLWKDGNRIWEEENRGADG